MDGNDGDDNDGIYRYNFDHLIRGHDEAIVAVEDLNPTYRSN